MLNEISPLEITLKQVPFILAMMQQVFKDGAEFGYNKANEWHDLRKDPNDLPKKDCEVITLHENGNKNIIRWKNGNWTNAIVIAVIAWCEIPSFDKT